MIRTFLTGNLAFDPRSSTTKDGVPVCTFTVAINQRPKRNGEEKATFYVEVKAWGQLGETCSKYLVKGRKVTVSAKGAELDTYIGKDGSPKARLIVTADDVEFMDRSAFSGQTQEAQARREAAVAPMRDDSEGFIVVDEDELPF